MYGLSVSRLREVGRVGCFFWEVDFFWLVGWLVGWLKRRNFLSWENSLMNGAIDTSDSYKVGPYDRFKWSYEAL